MKGDQDDLILSLSNQKFTILNINSIGSMTKDRIPLMSNNLESNFINCCLKAKFKIWTIISACGKASFGYYKEKPKDTSFGHFPHNVIYETTPHSPVDSSLPVPFIFVA